jgi:L-ascorbate metabolism protein UlaG (beta-lactamase superfamily)
MRLIKYTHACVRLESDGRSLVIDPGVYTEDAAFDGTHDVLVTHEHADHVDAKRLAGKDLNIYAPAAVVDQLARAGITARAVTATDTFTAAGFSVRAVGGEHAKIFGGMPDCANIGYVVDEDVYHPGDSYFVPDVPLRTLLVPVAGPWTKLGEGISFTRAVGPQRAFPIHDAPLSELGQRAADGWLEEMGETTYARIPIGGSVEF